MVSLLSPQERPTFFRTVSSSSQVSTRSTRSLKSFSHRKDKQRLYLGVFAKSAAGGVYASQISCDSYHWALIIGPKSALRVEAGTAYQIVHSHSDFVDTPYFYEETDLVNTPHQNRTLLARIALAKVTDEEQVIKTLRTNAVSAKGRKPSVASVDEVGLTCLSWVRDTWDALANDPGRPMKSYFDGEDWEDIESRARRYVKRKRMQGRYNPHMDPGDVTWNPAEIPTWNYWENRETTD